VAINEDWLAEMIRVGELPDIRYVGKAEADAEMWVDAGTHVIVQMLDLTAKTRHRVILLGGTLVARRDQWEASLAKAE
jgi:hypothetical protein